MNEEYLSPYKEVGLRGQQVSAKPKRRAAGYPHFGAEKAVRRLKSVAKDCPVKGCQRLISGDFPDHEHRPRWMGR